MSRLIVDGNHATLRPPRPWWNPRIPPWVALLLAAPFILLLGLSFIMGQDLNGLALFLLALPAGGFLGLWLLARRRSKHSGRVRFDGTTRTAYVTTPKGAEESVQFTGPLQARIEPVKAGSHTVWRIILSDGTNHLWIGGGGTRWGLKRRFRPLIEWLGAEIRTFDKPIRASATGWGKDWRTRPYAT